jgi:tetratricopeptide (TPR) repeat protein
MCMLAGFFFRTVSAQYQQALDIFDFTLICAVALEGHDSLVVAASNVNISIVLDDMVKPEEARVHLQKGLEIQLKDLGSEHLEAASYTGLGNVFKSQGKYEEALEMHTKSLDIKTRILGGDSHLDVATSYNNVSIIYSKPGKYEEALEMYKTSFAIGIRILGGDSHPSVAASYCNMGVVLEKTGKYEEALEMYTKSLEIELRVHGDSHPSVGDSNYTPALPHKKRKETDIARQLFLECEQIYTTAYGPDHRETVDAASQASRCV